MHYNKSLLAGVMVILVLFVAGCAIGAVPPIIEGTAVAMGNEGIKFFGKKYIYESVKDQVENITLISELLNQTNYIKGKLLDIERRIK